MSSCAKATARRRAPARTARRNRRGRSAVRLRRWRDRSGPWRLPDVGFVVVELEIDEGAERLEIGDERVGFRDALRIAVEVAHFALRIALGEIDRVRALGGRFL